MSTNPFRQTRYQQGPPGDSTHSPSVSQRVVSDGSGSRTADLSVDTKVPSSLNRHVSFASPPVDSTIPAASYPSSPESVRSPPSHLGQPATPNYRTAFLNDPFEDLGRDARQDNTIQEALSNAESNATIGNGVPTGLEETTIRDTLSRFAPAPRHAPMATGEPTAPQLIQATRQSLDVDAFQRLLLTGDSGRSTPGTATPPTGKHNSRVLNDSSSGTDITSLSQASIYDMPGMQTRSHDDTPRTSHEKDRDTDDKLRVPPPAPAPRRGKSVKSKVPQSAPAKAAVPESTTGSQDMNQEQMLRRPPTPPISRRHSHRTPSIRSEEGVISPSEASSPTESLRTIHKAPPPPPIPRQQSVSHRRPSTDLAPTIEEPETGPTPLNNNRRSSSDRPMPPISRNSSQSVKRQSLGFMNPPPVPPPRKGRASSRSSMDSFRPSLSSITGEESGQENNQAEPHRQANVKDPKNLNAPSADSILAELANLQKEVDAARRGA
ncbi:hypothetical protein PMZ80_011094 [Knufia obscura]|uniref:Uncharacterized protein n=1 Tax=Knufia obscura TaxID=1635080 RepID=A0ABR0R7M3_9EURO|nr:hypothetical protein PMZ80_011094 [Knufia obscura]